MKKNFLLLYSATFFFNSLSAQAPLVKMWDKRYGANSQEFLNCLGQTADGGYVLAGLSYSGIFGDKTQASQGAYDFWVIKADSLGVKKWDKRFGGTGTEWAYAAQQTDDGGYIIGGMSNSGISGDKTQGAVGAEDFWIVKTDANGIKQWDKDFGGMQTEYLLALQQTMDGGYILGGYSLSDSSGDKSQNNKDTSASRGDYWIVKTDAVGNKQWDKTFGGTAVDWLYTMQQCADGGYILGGISYSGIGGDKTEASRGGSDFWIVKTDALGSKQWDKRFGGAGEDALYSLRQTADGGYILGGLSNSGISGDKTQACWGNDDYWIIKIDAQGNKQWDKDFGGTGREDEFGTVAQTIDGGYIIGGTSYSPISGDKTESNLGLEQTWIVKTDSLGIKQWDKTLLTVQGHDERGYALQTKEGCYVFANATDARTIGGHKTQNGYGSYDYWMIKFCDTTFVAANPPVSNFLASDTSLCANNCVNFSNLSNNATSYQWFFAGAIPSSSVSPNPLNICYLAPGNYDVTLIVANSGGSDTLVLSNYITVKPSPPTPSISQVGTTLYCSTDPSYTSYQWFADTALIPGATDTSLVITQGGNYNVQVANEYGCRIAVGINIVLGIQNFMKDIPLTLFPNPVSSSLQFAISNPIWCGTGNCKLQICMYNVLGEKVLANTLSFGEGRGEADVSALPAGIYFIRLNINGENADGRFIKD